MLILINFLGIAQSPTWQWAKRCGSTGDNIPSISGNESFNDIKIDKNGNIYAVGNFYANTVFHNAQLFGAATPFQFAKDDAYLIKYSSCGQLLWWRRMGGTNNDGATSLVLDNQGKVIVTGYCTSNPSYYSGGANSTTISGAQANGAQFIAKFDTSGNFLSVNTYSLLLMKMLLNSQGDLFLTNGNFAATINSLGVVTSTLAFFTPTTPSYPAINDIKLDRSDNIYLCGALMDTVSINGGNVLLPVTSTILPGFAGNSLIMKLNSSGVLQWYQRSYSNGLDGLSKCALDTSETKIVTSGRNLFYSVIFGYTINTGVGTYANPIYMLNTSNGSLITGITGSANLQPIVDVYASDRDNNFYLSGNTNGWFALGNTTLTAVGGGPNRQNLLGKLNSTGSFLSMALMPQIGSSGANEKVYGLAISEQGNVILCGQFAGTLDSLGTAVTPISGVDGYVNKFGFPCGSTLTALSPLAPTSLTAAYQGNLSNLVTWVDNSNFENGFELWYHDASPTFSLLATLPANTTTYTHTGLSYTTTYCYKTRAINGIGPSAFTNSDCAATPAPAAPQAPTNLTALNTGSLINNVAWVDNSFNETSFELWYHGANPSFSLLATLAANTTTYTHTGLSPGTNYCYKALATNSIGSSVFTNTDCALTPALPNAPSNLVAANTGNLFNNVNWVDNSSDETNFELWYHDASPTFSLLVTLAANTTTYTHTGLTHTTTYCYKALATNSVGPSAFTNSDCATTPDTSTVGLNEFAFAKNIKLYPNPSKGTVYLSFMGNAETLHLKITDPLGRLLKEEEINTSTGENEIKITLPPTKGLYFIQLSNNTSTLSAKVLLE
ncbi:MAG: T9SS type A sorting domain-containing protein [Bacteroidia bacterium]|nr:T9SS type A sorting domain-containing protein [Bacteroidia bacterium]